MLLKIGSLLSNSYDFMRTVARMKTVMQESRYIKRTGTQILLLGMRSMPLSGKITHPAGVDGATLLYFVAVGREGFAKGGIWSAARRINVTLAAR